MPETQDQSNDQSTNVGGLTVLPESAPTVGSRALFHPNAEQQADLGVFDGQQPCHARVLYVWGARTVNLEVTGPSGGKLFAQNVPFVHEGEDSPEDQGYATAVA